MKDKPYSAISPNPASQQCIPKPSKKYKLSFPALAKELVVQPEKVPYSKTGLEGSILEIALAHGIEIDHACGGVGACATCHVHVNKGLDSCNEASEAELDQLDQAPQTNFKSRLACQTVPNGSTDVEVEIPSWNRNQVREGK